MVRPTSSTPEGAAALPLEASGACRTVVEVAVAMMLQRRSTTDGAVAAVGVRKAKTGSLRSTQGGVAAVEVEREPVVAAGTLYLRYTGCSVAAFAESD